MKSVVFSGSVRFYGQIDEWAEKLKKLGVSVDTPKLAVPADDFDKLGENEQRQLKLDMIKDHSDRIDKADVLFVFNPDGYVGNSVTLEIGYALAQKKPIYALSKDSEMGRDVIYWEYCDNPEKLAALLS